MATVGIVVTNAKAAGLPVPYGIPVSAEAITSSSTSQQSVGAVTNTGQLIEISVSGGDVWVQMGSSPVASIGHDYLILDGMTRFFGYVPVGTRVAVVDA